MKKKYRKNTFAFTMVMAGVICFGNTVFGAVRPTAKQFPQRTIIIGTYAIVLDAMTEEILSLAEESAKDNDQDKIYFKSDMNKDTWYDITDSSNITQISVTKDNIVTNTQIDQVPLTHYTKGTGETIDLRSGTTVSLTDLTDLSNPRNMPEMREIIQEREIQSSIKKSEGKKDKIKSIDRVLSPIRENIKDPKKDRIITMKTTLTKMEASILALQNDSGVSDEMVALAVQEKMKIEEQRKALCYELLYARLEDESQKLDYDTSGDLIDKYSNAMTQIQAKLAEMGLPEQVAGSQETDAEGNEDGSDADSTDTEDELIVINPLTSQKEKFSQQISDALMSGNTEDAKKALEGLAVVESIARNDDNVSDEMKKKQIECLESVKGIALSEVRQVMEKAINSELYQKAKTDGSNAVTLKKLREDMAANVKEAAVNLTELDNQINERQTEPAQQAAVLNATKNALEQVMKDAPYELQEEITVALTEVIAQVKEKQAQAEIECLPEYQELQKAMEKSTTDSTALYENYMNAVEKNDMVQANTIKQQMDQAAENRNSCEDALSNLKKAVLDGDIMVDVGNGTATDKGNTLQNAQKTVADVTGKQMENIHTDTGQQGTSGTTEGQQGGSGATEGQQSGSGATEGQQSGSGATEGQQSGSGATEGQQSGSGTTEGQQSGSGTTEGQQGGSGTTEGQQSGSGTTEEQQSGSGTTEGQQSGSGTTEGQQSGSGVTKGQQSGSGTTEGQQSGSGTTEGQQSGSGATEGQQSGSGATEGQQGDGMLGGTELISDSRYTAQEIALLQDAVQKNAGSIPPWKLTFKEYPVKLTVPLFVYGKEIYVPAEELGRQLGAQIIYSQKGNTVIIRWGSSLIEYVPNDTIVYLNDKKTVIKPAPYNAYGGKIYIPLSCFEKAFGFTEQSMEDGILVSKK